MRTAIKRLIWVVLILGIAAALGYAFMPAPLDVDLAQVTRGPLRVTVDQDGKTRIKDRYTVSTPLGGQLQRIRLRPGDAVAAGSTVLAAIEPADPAFLDARTKAEVEARVKATEAARQRMETMLARARQTHQFTSGQMERLRPLVGTANVSVDDFESAKNKEREAAEDVRAAQFAVRVAAFEHEQAKAALTRIQPRNIQSGDDERFLIRSPIDGKVLRVFQESASIVTQGMRLLELGNPSDLEMEIDVLSVDAVKIAIGAKVIIEHWGGSEPLAGVVRVVEPSAFLKVSALGVEEQRVNVIADFTDPHGKRPTLGDAYRVEARIVIWESDSVLKVPAGALFRRGEEWAIFAARDGTAQAVSVRVGRSNGLETEIIGGITENETIILHPSDRVKEGQKVVGR